MKLPGELFYKLFLKQEVAEELPSAEDYLFGEIQKAASADSSKVADLADYDSDMVKMAQIAVFFDVLNAFEE